MPHPVADAARHESLLLAVLRAPHAVRALSAAAIGSCWFASRERRAARTRRRAIRRRGPVEARSLRPRGRISSRRWWRRDTARRWCGRSWTGWQRALRPLGTSLVLLKGAAYLVRDGARGRPAGCPPTWTYGAAVERLDEVERALRRVRMDDGAASPVRRAVLPRVVARAAAVALPRARARARPAPHDPAAHRAASVPHADALASRSVPIASSPFRALAPPDQVLHLCAHLFQESDCTNRLRDIVDLDAMLRDFGVQESFWRELPQHAARHQLARPLWYGLRFAERFLGTPIPASARGAALAAGKPGPVARASMDLLVPLAMLPPDPDRGAPIATRLARAMLLARSHWLRMPPLLLVRHLAHKSVRRWMPEPTGADDGAEGA